MLSISNIQRVLIYYGALAYQKIHSSVHAEIIAILFTLVALYFHVRILFSNFLITSWDLPAHYYLALNMLENLKQFKIQNYNPYWFGGYDEFLVYGAGSSLLSAVSIFLGSTFTSLGTVASFHASILLLILLLSLGIVTLVVLCTGRKGIPFALGACLLYLAYPTQNFSYFIGLCGLLKAGVLAQYWGLVFFLFAFVSLILFLKHPRFLFSLSFGFFLQMIIFCHLPSFFIGSFILTIFSLLSWKRTQWKTLLYGISLTALPFLAWSIPCLSALFQLNISSTGTHAFSFNRLAILFPGISLNNLYSLLHLFITYVASGKYFEALLQICVELPWFSLIELGGIVLLFLHKKNDLVKSLLLTGLAALTVLPSEYLISLSDSTYRPYRSLNFIVLLFCIISSIGYGMFFYARWARAIKITVFITLCFSISSLWFFQLRLNRLSGNLEAPILPDYIKDAPAYSSAIALTTFLKNAPPRGRVAIEVSDKLGEYIGSPRLFHLLLPEQTKIQITTGLPEEVSRNSDILSSVLLIGSSNQDWSAPTFKQDLRFKTTPPEQLAWRMGQLSIQYIISSSASYRAFLLREGQSHGIMLVQDFGPLSLFQITDSCPVNFYSQIKPLIFLSNNYLRFKKFSRELLVNDHSYKIPVAYLPDVTLLKEINPNFFAGVVIDSRSDSRSLPQAWKIKSMLLPAQYNNSFFDQKFSSFFAINFEELSITDYCLPPQRNLASTEPQLLFINSSFSPYIKPESSSRLLENNLGFQILIPK